MKDITLLKQKLLALYRSQCPDCEGTNCKKLPRCECETVAEFAAHLNATVPVSCLNKHVSDFTGDVPGKGRSLPAAVVKTALGTLVRYIWGEQYDPTKVYTSEEMQKVMSRVLPKRRQFGNCLAIHGGWVEPPQEDEFHRPKKQERKPQGKTLLASIVATEVLRLRLFPGHASDSYEWISYPTLKSRVLSGDTEAISDYQTCDWLFVDNIDRLQRAASGAAKQYQLDKIDSVFLERVEQQLPTILVFQFDLNSCDNLAEEVGQGIAEIIADEKTFKINLTNPNGK